MKNNQKNNENAQTLNIEILSKSMIALSLIFFLAYIYFTFSSIWITSMRDGIANELNEKSTQLAELEMRFIDAESILNLDKAQAMGLSLQSEDNETYVAKSGVSLNAKGNE